MAPDLAIPSLFLLSCSGLSVGNTCNSLHVVSLMFLRRAGGGGSMVYGVATVSAINLQLTAWGAFVRAPLALNGPRTEMLSDTRNRRTFQDPQEAPAKIPCNSVTAKPRCWNFLIKLSAPPFWLSFPNLIVFLLNFGRSLQKRRVFSVGFSQFWPQKG